MAIKPRYRVLTDELRVEIQRGDFQGKVFPTEAELCERFSVSRFTVREALRALQVDGLIARKRGSGTVIKPAAARGGALHQPLSNVGEILQYARDTTASFHSRGEGPLPRAIAEQIGLVAGGRWTRFHGMRTGGGSSQPIATTDAYLVSRRQRKKVEMLFAHLKRILKLDRLRLRGPNGAKDEFHLAAAAQNLRKMAKVIPMPSPAPA